MKVKALSKYFFQSWLIPIRGGSALKLGLVLWCLLFSSVCHGQTKATLDSDQQWRFAEHYFELGEYYRAIGEYERLIYFFPDDPRLELAKFKIGEAYFKGEKLDQAVTAYFGLINSSSDAKLVTKSYMRISDCYVGLGRFSDALGVLDRLLSSQVLDPEGIQDQLRYKKGWVYLEMHEWQKADETFRTVGSKVKDLYQVYVLTEELSQRPSINYKNPALAGWLSLVPGAGHLYCGRYRDALVAFILNVAVGYTALEAFDHGNEGLGSLVTFVGLGLYGGNIYSAVSSAHKHNRRQDIGFLQQLKQHSVIEAALSPNPDDRLFALRCRVVF